MKTRIILVGKGGSGKDYIRKIFETLGFKYCKLYTTRPIREGEENGKDYIFIDEKDIPKEENLYQSIYFNNWFYGTPITEFEKSNLFIMTPKGISSIKKEDREKFLIIHIKAEEKIRRERLASRKDADDVDRRISADEIDFKDFKDYDYLIDNSKNISDESIETPIETTVKFIADQMFQTYFDTGIKF
jgi:guanylate kinase